MDEIGERVRVRLRSSSSQPGQARQDGLGLDEVDVRDLTAVPAVPAQSRPLEPRRFSFEQEQDELEGVRQANMSEVGRRGKRDPCVSAV